MPINSKINGDLIALAKSGKYNAIAHGCNCYCVMGAGIAPQIAKAFPEAEEVDNKTVRGDLCKLGNRTAGRHKLGNGERLLIFNLYTQGGTKGRRVGEPDINYPALVAAFGRLNEVYGCLEKFKIGIPMIGAGLAGGHWKAIELLIDFVTPDLDIELVIYEPPIVATTH